MKNKLTLIAQTVEQIFPHQASGSPALTPVGSGSQPVAVLMGGMLRAGHWGFSQAAQNKYECSVEENYLMFLYINSECCARFLIFFFPCIFINERKMLSDSPLKGCKSSDQLLLLSCMCHVILLTRVISTLQDIGVTHGRAMCQQGSLSKCLWKYFRVQRGKKIRR